MTKTRVKDFTWNITDSSVLVIDNNSNNFYLDTKSNIN